MKIIKKYDNRCLYDSELSSNITLDDVKKYVIDRIPFKIVHAKSEEDLTRSYLIQIILEMEGLDSPLFSQQALEDLIRFYGHPLQSTIQKYLEQVMTALANQQRVYQQNLEAGKVDILESMAALTAQNIKLWQDFWAPTPEKAKKNTE